MNCTNCTMPVEENYSNLRPGLCFTCTFWTEQMEVPENAVRINGKHYRIGDEQADRHFRGHGGQLFIIRFLDGKTVETTNLWHQGVIPPHFRSLLPDNAEFI